MDPSDSYFLFADFVDFYTHLTYICICTIFVAFFSATIDGRNLMFGHKLHIDTPYCGKHFLTRQIPTSCLPKSGVSISSQFILFKLDHFGYICNPILLKLDLHTCSLFSIGGSLIVVWEMIPKNSLMHSVSNRCVPKNICLSCLLNLVEESIYNTFMLTPGATPKGVFLDLPCGDQ